MAKLWVFVHFSNKRRFKQIYKTSLQNETVRRITKMRSRREMFCKKSAFCQFFVKKKVLNLVLTYWFKDAHREKNTLKLNSSAYEKYEYGHLGHWYIKLKNKVVTGKTPLFVIGPFCSRHSICLNIGFWQSSFEWKWCVFNLSGFN